MDRKSISYNHLSDWSSKMKINLNFFKKNGREILIEFKYVMIIDQRKSGEKSKINRFFSPNRCRFHISEIIQKSIIEKHRSDDMDPEPINYFIEWNKVKIADLNDGFKFGHFNPVGQSCLLILLIIFYFCIRKNNVQIDSIDRSIVFDEKTKMIWIFNVADNLWLFAVCLFACCCCFFGLQILLWPCFFFVCFVLKDKSWCSCFLCVHFRISFFERKGESIIITMENEKIMTNSIIIQYCPSMMIISTDMANDDDDDDAIINHKVCSMFVFVFPPWKLIEWIE